ncbi:phage protein GemA/Gp16 family protein, partial [Providencia rettgeri]
ELSQVRDYLHDQGYPRKSKRKYGRRPNVPATREVILSKIEALLSEAKRPWSYAEAMAKHMFKREKIEWLTFDELSNLMKALIIDAKRRAKNGSQNR